MDKIKKVYTLNEDEVFEEHPIGVDFENIDTPDGKTLSEWMGDINVDKEGTVKEQLDSIKITDEENNKFYVGKLKLVNGKPILEYEERLENE